MCSETENEKINANRRKYSSICFRTTWICFLSSVDVTTDNFSRIVLNFVMFENCYSINKL